MKTDKGRSYLSKEELFEDVWSEYHSIRQGFSPGRWISVFQETSVIVFSNFSLRYQLQVSIETSSLGRRNWNMMELATVNCKGMAVHV